MSEAKTGISKAMFVVGLIGAILASSLISSIVSMQFAKGPKGDANEDPDQWIVKKENVIGKAILTVPFIGYLGYFVRTPIGFILLILLPASAIIIMEIRNIVKELKKQKQEQTSKEPRKNGD